MSFAIPQHPQSASSDSGSSSSLTPTNANGLSLLDSDPHSAATSAPSSNSLFSSEESRFITDSLSSAESFDPFTLGAPGFKVPSLLPPNIAANHDHIPASSSSHHHASLSIPTSSASTSSSAGGFGASILNGPNLSLAGPSSGLDLRAIADQMRSRSLSQSIPQGVGGSPAQSSQQGSLDPFGNPASTHRFHNWNLYGYRGNAPSNPGSIDAGLAYGSGPSRHASFSGSPSNPSAVASTSAAAAAANASAAGYGKNKAWQMEQLSFLEAQASRAHPPHYPTPHEVQSYQDHFRRASTSALGSASPYNQYSSQAQSQHLAHLQQQQQHDHQAQAPFYNDGDDANSGSGGNGNGLAMLGAQFPSSHNFAGLGQRSSPHSHSRLNSGAFGGFDPTSFSAEALAMLSGSDAGLGAASADDATGSQTPKARKASSSRTPTGAGGRGESDGTPFRGARGRSPHTAWVAATSSSPSSTPLKRSASGSVKTSSASDGGPSSVLARALADVAFIDLDLDTAMRVLPPSLHQYFLPLKNEKKYQPHLEMLRRQHIEAGLLDPMGREIKKPLTKEEEEENEREKEREKKQHTLLTTEEKKANHIASEQKRRANIRKGYELLCEIVPSLKEALEREASGKGKEKGQDGSSDDDSDNDNQEDEGEGEEDKDKKGSSSKKKSNKKKGGSKKKDEDVGGGGGGGGGIEIDGERIDGRAGPRSEAVVLMKSLEHISNLIEKYRALLGRRNRARLAIAKKHNWNGLNCQPVPDIDRLLLLKLEEYWAQRGDDQDDDDEDEDNDANRSGDQEDSNDKDDEDADDTKGGGDGEDGMQD